MVFPFIEDADLEAVPRKKIKLSPESSETQERSSPEAPTKDQEKTEADEVTPPKNAKPEQKETRDSASPHDSGVKQDAKDKETTEESKQLSSDGEGEKMSSSDTKTVESERPKSPFHVERQEPRNETSSQDVPSTSTASAAVADSKGPVRRLSNSTARQQNFVDVLARSIEQLMKCLEQAV